MNTLPPYQYGGARTMVNLQNQYMGALLTVWRKAKAIQLTLPETDDPSYVSLETLIHHAFTASRAYIVWMTAKLGLPDPQIEPVPSVDDIEAHADHCLAHLTQQWRTPLADVRDERFGEVYVSNWGIQYSIDAMLEHAVMHPLLHRTQLEELLEEQQSTHSLG
jgi:uncharacterized damage-inducible protein DinB